MFSDRRLRQLRTAGILGGIALSFLASIWAGIALSLLSAVCSVFSLLADLAVSGRDKAERIRLDGVEWQPLSCDGAAAFKKAIGLLPRPERLLISYQNPNCEALAKSFLDILLAQGWPATAYMQATNPPGISIKPEGAEPFRAAVSKALGGMPVEFSPVRMPDNGYREIAIGLKRPAK